MSIIQNTKLLPYAKSQLFDLVMDIDSYHEFLPFCTGSRIVHLLSDHLVAEITIVFAPFSIVYNSRVITKQSDNLSMIEATALDGPFKHLSNIWRFKKEQDSTLVEFMLDFELKSLLLERAVSKLFYKSHSMIIQAFEKRAEYKYGTKGY